MGGALPADDPHLVLGVSPGASLEEIRSAFRAKARVHHPDARPDDPNAPADFRRIREAYQILRSRFSNRPKPRPESSTARDAFDRVFQKKRQEARYGPHPFHRPPRAESQARAGVMRVPFEAAIRGGDHRLEVEFGDAGGRRQLRVTLPPGVESDQLFRLEGRLVRARVEAHPDLSRDGMHVICPLPLTLPELVFGASVRVPTVDGMVAVDVPPGSVPGQQLRLKGKGVPPEGDQLCVVTLALPDRSREGVQATLRALDRADDRSPRRWDGEGTRSGTRRDTGE